jgi:hypothetical protein
MDTDTGPHFSPTLFLAQGISMDASTMQRIELVRRRLAQNGQASGEIQVGLQLPFSHHAWR